MSDKREKPFSLDMGFDEAMKRYAKTDPKDLSDTELDIIPVAIANGKMKIGAAEIDCAVLGDGTRVISDRGVSRALGTKRGGSHWLRVKEAGDGALVPPPYISANNLKPFIPNDLIYILTHPIEYRGTKSGAKANGLLATAFPKVLKVWSAAFDAGALKAQQMHIGEQAKALLAGLDEVAIIALVDEATGYQDQRKKDELQAILSAYVLPEHRPYLETVPKEFTDELFRIYGWERKANNQGPRYAGKLIRQLIYEKLPDPVLPKLDELNPSKGANYQRSKKHFQHLTENLGADHFKMQLAGVMALLRASPSNNPAAFKRLFQRAYGDQFELDLED